MARVNYSGLISEIVGNIGGSTFQKNKSGFIVRTVGHCKKSSTVKQTQAHAQHYNLLANYSALAVLEKIAWNDFATLHPFIDKFGRSKAVSGANWFCSINSSLLELGQDIITNPPTYELPLINWSNSGYLDNGNIWLYTTVNTADSDSRLQIFTTPVLKGSSTSFSRYLKNTHLIRQDVSGGINLVFYWQNAHGLIYDYNSLEPSNYIGVAIRAINVNSGISGPFQYALLPYA